jgi:hypothetical protein
LTDAIAEKQRMKRETIQEFKEIISIGMPGVEVTKTNEPKKVKKLKRKRASQKKP